MERSLDSMESKKRVFNALASRLSREYNYSDFEKIKDKVEMILKDYYSEDVDLFYKYFKQHYIFARYGIKIDIDRMDSISNEQMENIITLTISERDNEEDNQKKINDFKIARDSFIASLFSSDGRVGPVKEVGEK